MRRHAETLPLYFSQTHPGCPADKKQCTIHKQTGRTAGIPFSAHFPHLAVPLSHPEVGKVLNELWS